jgi:signal transduction histidine kinase
VPKILRSIDPFAHQSTPSEALAIVSVLLSKTVRSSTFRRALIWIGVFGTIVVVLFDYVYWSTSSYVLSRSDYAIAAEHDVLRRAYEVAGQSGLIAAIEQRITDERFQRGLYLLADPSFNPVAGNLKTWPSELTGTEGWGNFGARAWKPDAVDRTVLRARFATFSDGYHLLVAMDISDLSEFAKKINTALALVIALLLVLAGAASVSVTRRTVGRIETINATSRLIMQSGLDKRIPLHGTRDEWDQLAENLNSMLDRIETLMGEVKHVTDNVAHDLRTPLSRVRGRLEKACSRPREAKSDQSLIEATIADLDGLLRLFSSLTRISQIETSGGTGLFASVNLTKIAADVVELFDATAEATGGHLKLIGDQRVFIRGDRDLLSDAIANLIDNAIKHGGETGRVTVEVTHRDGEAIISVSDSGPGIPVEERANVFKRFYRLERSRGSPGNGLGLSVVAAVGRLHGADIEMLDNLPGLKVQLRFPRSMGAQRPNHE